MNLQSPQSDLFQTTHKKLFSAFSGQSPSLQQELEFTATQSHRALLTPSPPSTPPITQKQ